MITRFGIRIPEFYHESIKIDEGNNGQTHQDSVSINTLYQIHIYLTWFSQSRNVFAKTQSVLNVPKCFNG